MTKLGLIADVEILLDGLADDDLSAIEHLVSRLAWRARAGSDSDGGDDDGEELVIS